MFKFRSEHNAKDFFSGTILGSALGAVAAVFLAVTPKGKKIRRELAHKYREFSDKIVELNPMKPKKFKFFKNKVKQAKKTIRKMRKKASPMGRKFHRAKRKFAAAKMKKAA